ncbi:chitobiase/beta-hexosaminidase C-terminal domain-containing protein [Bacillus sp. FJAT-29953]|nr:chitobiase/beta-hexosaminidase C-terminal domain-containing protein [Bacillus sp. FJAT-29953]
MFSENFKRVIFKVIVLTLSVLLIFQSGIFQIGKVLAAADTTKPILKGITIESQEVGIGDTVKISIDAEDAESGIKSVYMSYQTPITEKLQGYTLKYNTDTGKYETKIDITNQIENGTWKIYSISIKDNAENDLALYNKDLSSFGDKADLSSGDFHVTGTTEADVTKPALNSIEVETREASVGDTVKISITAEDKETGIKSVYMSYQTPITEKLQGYTLKYNPDTGKYETKIEVTNQIENGFWKIYSISIKDNAGNDLALYNKDLSSFGERADLSSGDFHVTGTTGADVTKPALNNIEVEPKEASVGDTVKISITAEDKETGIKSVYLSYQTPITEKLQGFSLKYNPETGKYETKIEITDQIENGLWRIYSISIKDNAGNDLALYNKYLSSLGERVDLSSGEFAVTDGVSIKPLNQRVVTKNETWTSESINGDVYIGPGAVLTINGDVTVNGNIYVLGALVSYGTFNVKGTIHANNVRYGWSSTLYNGTVNIRSGMNNISTMSVSNRPVEEVPIEFYTSPIVAENGIIKYMEGATLPIADMYIEDNKVDLRWNGTFYLHDLNVGSKDHLTVSFIDVFGNTIKKQFPLNIIDTVAPAANAKIPGGYYGGPKLVELTMSEAGSIYYTLNGEDPSISSNKYSEPIKINKDTTLKFIAVDKFGNQSKVYTEKYKFFTVDEVTDQSTSIKGNAQQNSTIIAKTESSEWTGTANESGDFTIQIPTLSAGTVLKVHAISENGVESESLDITVTDDTAPAPPEVNEVTDQSRQVTGKAEVGTTIEVKVDGSVIGTAPVESDGTFTADVPLQLAGTKISITATDEARNTSEESTVRVKDVTAPTKPEVNEITDQSTQVSGKAETGTTVEVKVNDSVIGTGIVKSDGTFTIEIPLQPAGTTLTLIATDKAGNISKESTVKVKDVTAPTKPEVNEVTDQSTQITGKAEARTSIEVKVDGSVIRTAQVESDGSFTVDIPLQLAGTKISLTATDETGNTSDEMTVTVKDVTAPTKPEVNLVTDEDGQITGMAEAGTTITVKSNDLVIRTDKVELDGTFKVDIPLQPAGTAITVIATDVAGNSSEDAIVIVKNFPSVKYATHVQDYGWQSPVFDGAVSGTSGQAKRLESITISLDRNKAPYPGGIIYRTHVQDYGWQDFVADGVMSGTEGKAKRLEAVEIKLTGEMAKHFDIYYRVHAETYGWLDWAKNGQSAGTQGLSKRLEAIQIVLVQKGGSAPGPTENPFLKIPSVIYATHVQDYGWMNYVKDGILSGTQGEAKRLEGIKIDLQNSSYSGDVIYSTHVQDYGWLPNVANGAMSGTSGEAKRLEAITINLTGEIANYYDIYYRVHIQDYGWLSWAKNGMKAGSEGQAKRLEAIEIKLVPKGQGGLVGEDNSYMRAR